jgi:hypothetical protein
MLVSNFAVGWERHTTIGYGTHNDNYHGTSYELQITNLEWSAIDFQLDCHFLYRIGPDSDAFNNQSFDLRGVFESHDQLPPPTLPFRVTGPQIASGVQTIPARTIGIFRLELQPIYKNISAMGFIELGVPAQTPIGEFRQRPQAHKAVSVLLHARTKHVRRPNLAWSGGSTVSDAVDVSYDAITLASGKAENEIRAAVPLPIAPAAIMADDPGMKIWASMRARGASGADLLLEEDRLPVLLDLLLATVGTREDITALNQFLSNNASSIRFKMNTD